MSQQDLFNAIQSARAQAKAGAGSVLDVLLRLWQVDTETLRARLRDAGGVECILDPATVQPDFSQLDAVTAAQWRCVVVCVDGGGCWLACEDPWDDSQLRRAASRLRSAIAPAVATRNAMQRWLSEPEAKREMSTVGNAFQPGAGTAPAQQASGPIVAFVDAAIDSGYSSGASDIHFECDREGVTVKHRLDGVMTKFARLDGRERAEEVISRIKVLAQLDITERRLPQDGRFRFTSGAAGIDLRVSIMPSVFGEDAVLRLLDKAQLRSQSRAVSLDALGFDDENGRLIRDLANEPSGMLLVTGPTGSGKTTTVYAALSEINTGLEKIITIEDPVEYELPGVLQIPVNERKGLTFAKGLRSILRHDPDRILVGEIRDAETAEIAVQSALTGHLVFTTVHANGVGDIMGRFRHFGLDMFGFMSSLNGVVVQRLVRRLCGHCAGQRPVAEREQEWLARLGFREQPAKIAAAVGCDRCHSTGYHGRFVVSEVHVIDDVFRDHVTQGSALSVLKEHVFSKDVQPLSVQAAKHVLAGRTTPEEVKRVVGWL